MNEKGLVVNLEGSQVADAGIREQEMSCRSGKATIEPFLDVVGTDTFIIPSERVATETQVDQARIRNWTGYRRKREYPPFFQIVGECC